MCQWPSSLLAGFHSSRPLSRALNEKEQGGFSVGVEGGITTRCSGRGYRVFFKVRFWFAVVLVLVGRVVSAAPPLSSPSLGGVEHRCILGDYQTRQGG